MSLLTTFQDCRPCEAEPDGFVPRARPAAATEILVIDPDPAAANDPGLYMLRSSGLGVQVVASLDAGAEILAQGTAALVLAELQTGKANEGFDDLRRLIQLTRAPVVIRSDHAGPLDCVTALELGAADCLARSTHPLELLARVRARLRGAREAAPQGVFDGALAPNSWIFDERASTVLSWSGRRVALYRAAASLLQRLCSRPREPLSRLELVELLAEGAQRVAPRTVDVAISRLRRQLEPCDGSRLIRTVTSNGWVLDADVQAADGRMLLRS